MRGRFNSIKMSYFVNYYAFFTLTSSYAVIVRFRGKSVNLPIGRDLGQLYVIYARAPTQLYSVGYNGYMPRRLVLKKVLKHNIKTQRTNWRAECRGSYTHRP